MQSNQISHAKFVLTTPALLSLFGIKSSFPNPDDPDHPGPWGPVIRRAEDRVSAVLGPSPDPWWRCPDPNPWGVAFAGALAEEVIDRANQMQQVADALAQTGNQRAIIIIGGFLDDYVDKCGTVVKLPFLPRHPHRDPRLSPFEFLVMAAQFQEAANATTNEGLRQEFLRTGERLLEKGTARLQSASAKAAG